MNVDCLPIDFQIRLIGSYLSRVLSVQPLSALCTSPNFVDTELVCN